MMPWTTGGGVINPMPGIELNLTPTFQRSLAKLNKQEQAVVNQAVMSFWMNPDLPGLRIHPLKLRENRFHSISPNMDLRVIVLKDGARHVMMYVGHHDRAYAWAERRTVERHPVTGSAQIVEFEEVVREEIVHVRREVEAPPLFAQEDDHYLLSLGVPPAYLSLVKQVGDENGLLDLCLHLPEEAQEALLDLASGGRPQRISPVQIDMLADPFEHPDARRRFWVVTDEKALASALERPWAEWLVFLHPSQRLAVERYFDGPARVSGTAGTGKSIVSMHRAAHLARNADSERVLLTTFSKVLASRLANGVDQILGADSAARQRMTISHLHAYAHRLLAESGRKFEIIQRDDLSELLTTHRKELNADKFSDAFMEAEWNAVIDYWGLENWDDYEKVNRTGRGVALPAHQRRQLWQTFSRVRAELKHNNYLSWGDLCDEARRLVESNGTKPFRHVIIDESQDLGPRELRFAASLAPQGPQSLFFAGDIGQLIYRYPFSWLSVGIDVRGRSQRLKVNYRTSEQIQRFADSLVGQRLVDADEQSDDRATMSPIKGPRPEIIGGRGPEAEREALRGWINELLENGFAPDEIAIFARTKSIIETQVAPVVESLGLEQSLLSADTHDKQGSLNVGTLHAAKGLEFMAVAVVGCDEETLPLKAALDAEYEEEAKAIALAREQQLLYVGCTRARERLLVTYAHTPSRFLPPTKARTEREPAY